MATHYTNYRSDDLWLQRSREARSRSGRAARHHRENYSSEKYAVKVVDALALDLRYMNVEGSSVDERPVVGKFPADIEHRPLSREISSWHAMYKWAVDDYLRERQRKGGEINWTKTLQGLDQCAAGWRSTGQVRRCENSVTKGGSKNMRGGHVILRFGDDLFEGCYLIPLCASHNSKTADGKWYMCRAQYAVQLYKKGPAGARDVDVIEELVGEFENLLDLRRH